MAAISRRTFLVGGFACFPYLYYQRVSVAVRRYRAPVRNLPPSFHGFTILHLTDLHDKEFGRRGEDLLGMLRELRFDLVALTGDLVVGEQPSLDPALDLVKGIGAFSKSPVFSVAGNHEWALQLAPKFNERLAQAGVRVLSNEAEVVRRGEDRLWVVGVDDPVTDRDRLERALKLSDEAEPRLLLSHAPHPFPRAAQAGVDLMLVGHTHGGQVRFPFIGAAYVPSMGYLPEWDYGMYRRGNTTMIVNGGLGESWLPVRVNIRPEVALVTLEPFGAATADPDEARG